MNLTHGSHKSVRIDQDETSQDGHASTPISLTVDSDEEETLCVDGSSEESAQDEENSGVGCESHVQWDDKTEPGEQPDAGHSGHKDASHTEADSPDEQPSSRASEQARANGLKEPPLTALSLLVQREDSLSLAHRRMSAHDSPRSRHSTGEVSKGDQRRSRFHFAPADLLNAETFHQVTGSIKALYHRSISLGTPQAKRSSFDERGRSGRSRHSPVHALRSSMKRATSEGLPAEAELLCPQGSGQLPDCPEAGQGGSDSPARHPNRSSLKTSLSRRNSLQLQACGLEVEPLHDRRISVHFE
ncbi:g2549 [Coccomyxa viridis]|uniref:G2549 protein n=1 Tax=Coccomyxa viridis TaxID=1274662 RepID=A0ABP1FSL1_9CHLO